MSAFRQRLEWLGARLRPYAPALAVSLLLCAWSVREVLARAGEPALPLDDSFIHLQYARRLSQGHWFSYSPSSAYSSGATSMLWPMLLAPFFWLGFDELRIIWVVWLLGALLLAGVIVETARLARGLGSVASGVGAGAMAAGFGAFTWFAFSGMETIAFTWVLCRGVRVACDHAEGAGHRRQLIVLGMLAPLVRPEGVLVSIVAVLALLSQLRRPWSWRPALASFSPLLGPVWIPAMHRVLSGSFSSSTAMVKWHALDPYLDARGVVDETLANVELMLHDLLAGGHWTRLFMVEGFHYALAAGVLAMLWRARRPAARWRVVLCSIALLGSLIPCTYSTILWNRVRYIWPFAPLWFAVASCFAAELGMALGRRRAALEMVTPALVWGMAAAFAVKLPDAVADLAQSARAIDLQQVALGRWAKSALPEDARIGVNDTGAIAYMSRRATFDVVGLTTTAEARYWAEGSGSRFEHYEKLSAAERPTHFIVYPGWMAMPALLGKEMTRATVLDQSILGGRSMMAYPARYDRLGSGALPFEPPPGTMRDELDVSDLESERAHRYARLDGRARYNVVTLGIDPRGRDVADGGRKHRSRDRFEIELDRPLRLIARVDATEPLRVSIDGQPVGETRLRTDAFPWQEVELTLPARSGRVVVDVSSTGPSRFDSYHYWFWTD